MNDTSNCTSGTLHISGLHPAVTEMTLFDTFRRVGPINSIRICRDPMTVESLGYGFIEFQSRVDARRTMCTEKFDAILGKPIRLKWDQRDPSVQDLSVGTVVVKNLPLHIDNADLYDFFSSFGDLLSCKVIIDSKGRSKGFGFVQYTTKACADKAVKELNGMKLGGNELIIEISTKRGKNKSLRFSTETIYVGNLNEEVTEDELMVHFQECGPISGVRIIKDEFDISRGFGFIQFESSEAAMSSISSLDGTYLKRQQLKVCKAQTKAEHLQQKSNSWKNTADKSFTKLHVANLPADFDESKFQELFEAIGGISKVQVFVDEQNPSSRCGIINFIDGSYAREAIADLNGKIISSGKILHVRGVLE